jgi:hypothetical protein
MNHKVKLWKDAKSSLAMSIIHGALEVTQDAILRYNVHTTIVNLKSPYLFGWRSWIVIFDLYGLTENPGCRAKLVTGCFQDPLIL